MVIHTSDQGPWGKPRNGGTGGSGGGWKPGGYPPKGPSDIDEMFNELKKRYHELFGGDHGNRGIVTALGVFFLLWLASGIYQVQPGEQGVVTRFGKFDRISTSGLRYHLPTPFESVEIVNTDMVRMETLKGDHSLVSDRSLTQTSDDDDIIPSDAPPDEILMLTGDENIISLGFSVRWKVNDAKAFVFNLPNPEQTVRAVTESAMREVIGRTTIQSALTDGKLKVQDEVQKLVQDTLNTYKSGIDILTVNMLDSSFPRKVVGAARDVQKARADQERMNNDAQTYKNGILPDAHGLAQRMVQEAQGYKQEVVAKAQGDAARFLAVYSQYKAAEDVTVKRMYLETMEKIMANTNKVIIDGKSGTIPYLPLPAAARFGGEADKKGGQ